MQLVALAAPAAAGALHQAVFSTEAQIPAEELPGTGAPQQLQDRSELGLGPLEFCCCSSWTGTAQWEHARKEAESWTEVCDCAVCAAELCSWRSCFCTVDNQISLPWAHPYRNRPCCCTTDEVGAVSSAAAWNREMIWTFAVSWQVHCTDNLSWHHGPWRGETKTHRRQNPGILFLKLVKKEDTNKLFKWTLVFPVSILMTSNTACDSACHSSSIVLEFQLHFKWYSCSTPSLVTVVFLIMIKCYHWSGSLGSLYRRASEGTLMLN